MHIISFEHGACRLSAHIANHDIQTYTTIGKHHVQTILFGSELSDHFMTLSGNSFSDLD